jgi:hypothetical protein
MNVAGQGLKPGATVVRSADPHVCILAEETDDGDLTT